MFLTGASLYIGFLVSYTMFSFEGSEEVDELKRIIRDLLEVMDFDAENCDFGPAYGMWEKRKKKALADARRATK